MLAGLSVAFQASLTAAAQRTLGPVMVVAMSGLTTGLLALLVSLMLARPEFTGRAVGYTIASGVLGGIILGSIAFAAGQNGVARTLSVVIATQLLVSLLLDALGLFGAGAALSPLKVFGVAMILVGGILVVRF